MKTPIALTLIILGAMLLLAPLMVSFLLTAFDKTSMLNPDDRTACQIGGGAMILVGVLIAVMAQGRSDSGK
ncbi:MAG TPA: hypothetical protein VG796_10720 [Verrucomicrobiales bacterium]|jgi:hypothetical protein|nr:hypothetical protein [Verrucomicrobiales bacterium]